MVLLLFVDLRTKQCFKYAVEGLVVDHRWWNLKALQVELGRLISYDALQVVFADASSGNSSYCTLVGNILQGGPLPVKHGVEKTY